VRIAVISDIHGNLDALDAVIADAGAVDEWWCLGDVVGYGAEPDACVARVRDIASVALAGNHDLAAIGGAALSRFNDDAQACLRWTAQNLKADHAAYLRALPHRLERNPFTLVHASPRDPVWEYVLDGRVARANFAHFAAQFCLLGHTHRAGVFDERGRVTGPVEIASFAGAGRRRYICNPGSVGQPRDRDWRASYLLLEESGQQWEWRRVAYDVDRAAARIRAAGLPEIEAARLAVGW